MGPARAAPDVTQVNATKLDNSHCLLVMDAISLVCSLLPVLGGRPYRWFVLGNAIETARASSSLLGTYLSDERCGDRERTARELQWKRGRPPRRRPEHDLRALARVEFRVVARTLEDVLVAAFGLHPFRDGTSGMRADRRVGDDAIGRARAGVLIKLAGIEPD